MRRSRAETAETRRRIVERAAQLFRARGLDAVSVADIMGSLGLTVGGFYRHFASKDALVAEAIDAASLATTAVGAGAPAAAVLGAYLSDAHRKNAARGCPVAALCSEVAHQGRSTKKAFTLALERLVDAIARVAPDASRQEALHTASAMVGAVVLARATSDDALAAEILQAVNETLTSTPPRPRRSST
jgi:TetR/AcrR family transcriptional repressor of nem operon